ncbi:MAG: hypothetical protein SWJ54_22565, partial [Cyanobacteriota bacterium]|nr:hypothetical protein [Cyanobacteriota bacterium]
MMTIKLANPFYYPTAILIGGVVLVTGLRVVGLSNSVILPTAAIVTVASASVLKSREPDAENIAQQQLQQEVQILKTSSQNLAIKAEELRQEANQLISQNTFNLDFLAQVQAICDRTIELPQKIENIAQRLPRQESLLSVNELERQLLEVQTKIRSSSGITRQNLEQLAASLQQNIELAKTGQDTRQAKIISLSTLIQNSAGVLQQLQNK